MLGERINQNNITANGDVAGRDINHIHNHSQITWYQKRFQRLADEIEQDIRYEQTIDDLKYYETILDGEKGLEEKLSDGKWANTDISLAIRQKQKFAKKQEKYKYYVSAQLINTHLFAEILLKFKEHIKPMIEANEEQQHIFSAVCRNVIDPILQKLNVEGFDDDYLCYDAEDVLGMIYYLTGSCHINWKDYSNV